MRALIAARRWRRGRTPLTARRLNEQLDLIPGPTTGADMLHGPALHATETGRQSILTPVGHEPRGLASIIQPFAVRDVQADYLVCRPYYPVDDSIDSTDVYVAKPYMLQQTPFDGYEVEYDNAQTIEYAYDTYRRREADDGTNSEYQVMTPDYVTDVNSVGHGETILAVHVATNVVLPVASVTSTTWSANTHYAEGARVKPTTPAGAPNENLFYQCIAVRPDEDGVPGTSGASEPSWPTTLYETIVDNELVWIAQQYYIDWQDLNTAGRFWGRE